MFQEIVGVPEKGQKGLTQEEADTRDEQNREHGWISVADAVRIVECAPGYRDVQREGLRVLQEGGSMEEARRVMLKFLEDKKAEREGGEGFNDVKRRDFNRFYGRYQTRKLKEIEEARRKAGEDESKRAEEEEQLRKWKQPSAQEETLREVQQAYVKETGGQLWLDGAHFSVAGEDLRKCYARKKDGSRLGRDVLIRTPQGNLDWFTFPKDEHTQEVLKKKGIKDLPIRLKVGLHKSDHAGFGWMHILNHFDDMQAAGESPLMFLYNTLRNFVSLNAQGRGRYALKSKSQPSANRLLVVDLREDDGCYSMVSCYPIAEQRQVSGTELLIGRALFRFNHSNDSTLMEPFHPTGDKVAIGEGSTRGKAQAKGNLTEEKASVNIHDIEVVNEKKEVIYRQPYEEEAHFSLKDAKARVEDVFSRMEATAERVKKAARENGGKVFVRWTSNPEHDSEPGAYSVNHATGVPEAGLSVIEVNENMSAREVMEALLDYSSLNWMWGNRKATPFIFTGELLDVEGSDGEPLIEDARSLGYVNLKDINDYMNARDALRAYDDLMYWQRREEANLRRVEELGGDSKDLEGTVQKANAHRDAWMEATREERRRSFYPVRYEDASEENMRMWLLYSAAGSNVRDLKERIEKAEKALEKGLEDFAQNKANRRVIFTPGMRRGAERKWGESSFSVAGEHADAGWWERNKHRAFRGRRDGKLRVELDASKARWKAGVKPEEWLSGERYWVGDVLDFPELFEAYPQLRGYDIVVDGALEAEGMYRWGSELIWMREGGADEEEKLGT